MPPMKPRQVIQVSVDATLDMTKTYQFFLTDDELSDFDSLLHDFEIQTRDREYELVVTGRCRT